MEGYKERDKIKCKTLVLVIIVFQWLCVVKPYSKVWIIAL